MYPDKKYKIGDRSSMAGFERLPSGGTLEGRSSVMASKRSVQQCDLLALLPMVALAASGSPCERRHLNQSEPFSGQMREPSSDPQMMGVWVWL